MLKQEIFWRKREGKLIAEKAHTSRLEIIYRSGKK